MESLIHSLQHSSLATAVAESFVTESSTVAMDKIAEPEIYKYYQSLESRFVDIYTRNGEIPKNITTSNALDLVIEKWEELVQQFEQVRDKAPASTVQAYIKEFETINEAFFMERNRLAEDFTAGDSDYNTSERIFELMSIAMDRAYNAQYFVMALKHEVTASESLESIINGVANL